MDRNEKRPLMVPLGWMQAAAIVLIFGFFIMGVLTYYTYNDEPPLPAVVKTTNASSSFTREDILGGQQIFLRNGLMEYGSIFGHGAYLGPDFTAEYLHRAALSSIDFHGGTNSDTARSRTIQDFKTNRYDSATGALVYTDAQAHAFNECRAYYASFFGEPTTKFGLRPSAIQDPEDIRKLTAFFSWSAWAASAGRPGHPYSYTNNWPPEPLVDNHATADSIVWSVLSPIALLGKIGLLLAVIGRAGIFLA
jgi:nitric oxide reductase subunit B